MRRLALVPIVFAAALIPLHAQALGVGKIEMQSALNQRMDAEIPLRDVPADESGKIHASLASKEAFRKVDLERPFALTRLRFEVDQHANGDDFIHVTSTEPITEPFLSFLIKIDWSGSNLLRKYTVLIDPPEFADGSASTNDQSGDAAASGSGSSSQSSERQSGGSGTSGAAASANTSRSSSGQKTDNSQRAAANDEYGPVREGETLWAIAARMPRGGANVQQVMLALLRANPKAFDNGNINRLKQGYVLRIPDTEEMQSISSRQAIAQVQQQNSAWQGTGSSAAPTRSTAEQGQSTDSGNAVAEESDNKPELAIVGSDEGDAATGESASATGQSDDTSAQKELDQTREELESAQQEKKELNSRVDQLEQTVDQMKKLLSVRSKRLKQLQQQLSKAKAANSEGEGSAAVEDSGDEMQLAESDTNEQEDLASSDATKSDATDAATASGDNDKDTAAADQTEPAEETGDADQVATADAQEASDSDAIKASGEANSEESANESGTDDGLSANGDDVDAADSGGDEVGDGEATDADAGSTDASNGSSKADDADQSASDSDRSAEADEAYVPQDKAATSADREVHTSRTQHDAGGVFGWINRGVAALSGMAGLVVLGVILLLLILAGLAVRRRQSGGDATDSAPSEQSALDEEADEVDSREDTIAGDAGLVDNDLDDASAAEDALMAESFDVGSMDESSPDPNATQALSATDTSVGSDDTLDEADTYLAYGLHQQADDLLQKALERDPDNHGYREKLLEAVYAAGETDRFIEQAQRLRSQVSVGDPHWQRVLPMGREIAPNQAIFAEGQAAGTVDDIPSAQPDAPDLDLGSDDEAAEAFDFSLDDAEPIDVSSAGGDDPGDQADDTDMSLDTPVVDAPDDNAVETPESPSFESTPDSGDGDLDLEFDLGDLEDSGDSTSQSTAPSDNSQSTTQDTGATDQADAATPEFDLGDIGDDDEMFDLSGVDTDPEPTTASRDKTADDAAGSDDTDLGDEFDLTLTSESESPVAAESDAQAARSTSSELDEPAATVDASDADADAEDDEYDTMLALAQAYVDMGDADSARNALEEVAASGNEKQRAEAESLLERVG